MDSWLLVYRGVDTSALRGGRIFQNYESATNAAAREAVSKAINERVLAKKTISLGLWSDELRAALHSVFGDFTIFPLGAVPCPRETHMEKFVRSRITRGRVSMRRPILQVIAIR